jgi:glycosyltransferase involved in cell wall biosynthesis
LIYHVHSPTRRDSTRPVQNWINAQTERFSVRWADRLVAVSGSLAQSLEQAGMVRDRIDVVRNGVPVAAHRRNLQPPRGTWTIGSVALFRPRKGIEVLIEALAQLRAQGLNVQLHAVGPFETESYEHKIKSLVRYQGLNDLVRWTGFSSDVSRELVGMDLFVLPSLFGEGLPMVVLEAMAAGVPVVGTWVEGIPEAVRDGLDGVLAQPNDADALAAAIRRVILDLDWNDLQNSAIRRHAECFSDRAMAAGVAAAYRTVGLAPTGASGADCH